MANIELRPHILFSQALSGEFTAQSDPEGRKHTLANLAVATFLKGKADHLTDTEGMFEYSPSWAPDTTSVVRIGLDVPQTQLDIFATRLPASSKDYGFTVSEQRLATNAFGQHTYLVINDQGTDTETPYELKLGSELAVAKEHLVELALRFYNRNS